MAETEQLRKIFVGGLNWETSEETLRDYFLQWGNVIDCTIMRKPDKTSRGFGFITYDKAKCVDECLKVRKHELDGRQIEPKRAVPRDEVNNPSAYQKTKKIFVGGLASTTTEEDIEEYFNKLLGDFGEGKIVDVELKRDRETNRIRGFAYVTFDSDEVVEKMVSIRNHEIKMKHCDVKKAESQAQLRRKQELEGNYRPKFSSYQGSASRERTSDSTAPTSQNMSGFGMANWGPGFFGGLFGGGGPGQGVFGGPGRGGNNDSERGSGGFSGSAGGGMSGNWGLGNWMNPGGSFGRGTMGFGGFGPAFGGFSGFPFGFGNMGYGPGFGAGYGSGFGFGPGSSSGGGMGGGGYGGNVSGGGSSSNGGGSGLAGGYGKSDGNTSGSFNDSDRAMTAQVSASAMRDGSGAYGFGYGQGMMGQPDWSSFTGFAGSGSYPGMAGSSDVKTSAMSTAGAVDSYPLGSYNQGNSNYGPSTRGAAGRTPVSDATKRVFRPY